MKTKIERIGRGLLDFWAITVVLFFIFIGAIHAKYPYETVLVAEMNRTLGMAGTSFAGTLFREGASKPTFWIIFFIIVIIGNLYFFVVREVIDIIKEGKKNETDN